MVNNLGLKAALPFLGYGGSQGMCAAVAAAEGNVVFYHWPVARLMRPRAPAPQPASLAPQLTLAVRARRETHREPDVFHLNNPGLFRRIGFPKPSASNWGRHTGTPDSPTDCDFPSNPIAKITAEKLKLSAPFAYEFIKAMHLSQHDIEARGPRRAQTRGKRRGGGPRARIEQLGREQDGKQGGEQSGAESRVAGWGQTCTGKESTSSLLDRVPTSARRPC